MAVDEQILTDRILEAENLTDELEDDAATPLLKWGTGQVGRLVRNVEDEELAGGRINALMAVMRQINRLVGRGPNSPDELTAGLGQLIELYARAFGASRSATAAELEAAAGVLAQSSRPQAVGFILEWLAQPEKGQNL